LIRAGFSDKQVSSRGVSGYAFRHTAGALYQGMPSGIPQVPC
jgi:hypothetical protein